MLGKIMGAECEKEFGGVTVKAVPLPNWESFPIIMKYKDDVFTLGQKLGFLTVVDISGPGIEPKYNLVDSMGAKKKVVDPSMFKHIPLAHILEVQAWICELHEINEEEKGN